MLERRARLRNLSDPAQPRFARLGLRSKSRPSRNAPFGFRRRSDYGSITLYGVITALTTNKRLSPVRFFCGGPDLLKSAHSPQARRSA